MQALEETHWDLEKAVKYFKLKQLLSLEVTDVHYCKQALLACQWNVEAAADYMLLDRQPSPECVEV